ncbi:MAG: NRDE family protein [Oleispira sp.]|nr:NRDE family protein [Oleispira sp.]
MCLITFQWQPDADTKLVLSANRDEFLHRPALPLHAWQDIDGIYAGKDLSLGGTWLGVHKNGRFAALTNHRNMTIKGPEKPISRGNLVLDFLTTDISPLEYLQLLEGKAELYQGYNLLVADQQQLAYFSNRSQQAPHILAPGIYGLSNALLNSPWPKVEKAKQQLKHWLGNKHEQALSELLSSTAIASDEFLPNTGIGLGMERILSSQKIITPNYGTRCSTGLVLTKKNINIEEISWHSDGQEASRHAQSIELCN